MGRQGGRSRSAEGPWPTGLLSDKGDARRCCLTRGSAVHILLTRAADSLLVVRGLYGELPDLTVPDVSSTGYWVLQPDANHTKKPLRAAPSAPRRTAVHRAALAPGTSSITDLDLEEFAAYRSHVGNVLGPAVAPDLDRVLLHGPTLYWGEPEHFQGSDARRFGQGTVLHTGQLTDKDILGAQALVLPHHRGRIQRVAEVISASHVDRPVPVLVILHFITRGSLRAFFRNRPADVCNVHSGPWWYVGPIVTAESIVGVGDVDDDDDDEDA